MWTNKERGIAKSLLEPDTMAFITKVFVDLKVAGVDTDLEKNILLDNDKYGELMKVVHLVGKENKHRINLIKQAAQTPKKEGTTATAPR